MCYCYVWVRPDLGFCNRDDTLHVLITTFRIKGSINRSNHKGVGSRFCIPHAASYTNHRATPVISSTCDRSTGSSIMRLQCPRQKKKKRGRVKWHLRCSRKFQAAPMWYNLPRSFLVAGSS